MTENFFYTDADIQADLDYRRAQAIAKELLKAGLLTRKEYKRLTAINREIFHPLFSEIMPEMT